MGGSPGRRDDPGASGKRRSATGPDRSGAGQEVSPEDVLVDDDGTFRYDRLLRALRGAGTDRVDLVPWLVGGGILVAVALAIGALGRPQFSDLFGPIYVGLALGFVVAYKRVENYYESDETVLTDDLKAQYARGEIDYDEFRTRLDRTFGVDRVTPERAGPRTDPPADPMRESEYGLDDAWSGERRRRDPHPDAGQESDRSDSPAGSTNAETDAEAILRERFARGEIDDAEYRRRLALLRETREEIEREREI